MTAPCEMLPAEVIVDRHTGERDRPRHSSLETEWRRQKNRRTPDDNIC
jgi:hypothetical protein